MGISGFLLAYHTKTYYFNENRLKCFHTVLNTLFQPSSIFITGQTHLISVQRSDGVSLYRDSNAFTRIFIKLILTVADRNASLYVDCHKSAMEIENEVLY
jgi:hypothetical protein